MEKDNLWDNNWVLAVFSTIATFFALLGATILSTIITRYLTFISPNTCTSLLTSLFSGLIAVSVKILKRYKCLDVTVLVNAAGKFLEERAVDLDEKNFDNKGVCKLKCEVILKGVTQTRTLLIKLEPGVDISFNKTNSIKEKRARFANIFTESNGEKGVEFDVPLSQKWDRTVRYTFDLYLEQESATINYEKAYTVSLKDECKTKWFSKILVNLKFNSLNFKIGE
ncbi:hypothetical protein [Lactiplantibacillus plantarum]|uniref:hypothetical protein n=1 Tax=Lactiplantibacillus plantarum TaxID=1590 RepID=UPI0021A74909|nr:hypothetical protein [Lactiplantibacillus plantarum]MCT3231909.1 hypothetical protein [Lactiplantibacillus plantarum]MCT3549792.1 hypothetical protein [Lactiplantibacillus plantarum]